MTDRFYRSSGAKLELVISPPQLSASEDQNLEKEKETHNKKSTASSPCLGIDTSLFGAPPIGFEKTALFSSPSEG